MPDPAAPTAAAEEPLPPALKAIRPLEQPDRIGATRLLVTPGPAERVALVVFALAWAANLAILVHAWLVPSGTDLRRGLVISLVALMLVFLGWRQLVARAQLRRGIDEAYRTLERLQDVAEAALTHQPLDAVLGDLLPRVCSVLGVDVAIVLLTTDTQELAPVSAYGATVAGSDPLPVARALGERVLATGRPMLTQDAGQLGATLGTTPQLATAAAWPLVVQGQPTGVLVVGTGPPRTFTDEDVHLLKLLADRTATAVERSRLADSQRRAQLGADHARRHLTLLVEASRAVLHSVDDYEEALRSLIDAAVPMFADYGAVYLGDARRPRLLAARHHDAGRAGVLAALHDLTDDGMEPVRRVMATGKGQLVKSVPPQGTPPPWASYTDAMAALGVTSYVIAPIRVRGLAFGAIAFGTSGGRRGYRPSDLAAVEETANRAALAIERVQLYRQTRDAAEISARQSERLYTLLEAWPGLVAADDRADIARLAAQVARRALRAVQVQVWLTDADVAPLVATDPDGLGRLDQAAWEYLTRAGHPLRSGGPGGAPPADVADQLRPPWICVPVAAPVGPARGGLLAVGPVDAEFMDEDEAILGLLAEMVSVTLTNAELNEATSRSEARLSALIESSPVAIIDLDDDGRPRSWNPAAERMFGPAVTTPEGRTELFSGELADRLRTLGVDAHRRQQVARQEFRIPATDGSWRWLSVSVSPVEDGRAGGTGLLVMATEETEQRRLAEQLQQAQRLEAVGRLAGGVAHDFNNLLTVILGYTDNLLRKFDPDDPYRDRIAAIHRAGTRGAELTRKLLTISRRDVVNPVVLRPADVVSELEDMLRRLVGEDVRLTVDTGADVSTVLIDRGQFEQVLFNLAVNARDAMPEGGELVVTVHPDQDGHTVVRVRDTGHGMDETTLQHCLEPFFTTKPVGQGTGLGLAAVYGIVTQAGGSLHIVSRPGVGTTVSIRLPTSAEEPDDDHRQPAPRAADASRQFAGDVLVVEDEPDLRSLVRRVLKTAGYTVLAAASGEEALALLAGYRGPIDLVLTDVVMPGMSGPELAARLTTDRQVPVLFMTGYAEQLVAPKLDGQTAARVLRKPFTPEELLAAVEQVLGEAVTARTGTPLRAPS